jgi:hypothetical protein
MPTIEGQVENVNPRGIRVGGAWYNYSQHYEVPHPNVGDHVTLEIDGRGWIRQLTIGRPGARPPAPPPASEAPRADAPPALERLLARQAAGLERMAIALERIANALEAQALDTRLAYDDSWVPSQADARAEAAETP